MITDDHDDVLSNAMEMRLEQITAQAHENSLSMSITWV